MKLIIGSAQFGSNYGISNDHFLDEMASHNIMEFLITKNYYHIDAALAYGNSNSIIKSFSKKNLQHIYSKFSYRDSKTINKGIHDCMQALGVDKLEGVYLHNVNDFIKYKDIAKEIKSAKEQELIKYFGVSLYRPDDLNKIDLDLIDILQIPINILDNRFSMAGVIEECKNRGIQIFGRSIFLQGLLLMSEKRRPLWSKDYESFFNVIDKLCIKLNLERAEICIRSILSLKLDGIILGVSSMHELKENLRFFESGPIDIKLNLPNHEYLENLLDPTLWPQKLDS